MLCPSPFLWSHRSSKWSFHDINRPTARSPTMFVHTSPIPPAPPPPPWVSAFPPQGARQPGPQVSRIAKVLVDKLQKENAFGPGILGICDGKNMYTVKPLPVDPLIFNEVVLPELEYANSSYLCPSLFHPQNARFICSFFPKNVFQTCPRSSPCLCTP